MGLLGGVLFLVWVVVFADGAVAELLCVFGAESEA